MSLSSDITIPVDCMGLGTIHNVILDVPRTLVGDIATYTCQSGYAFADREASKSISCQSHGKWTAMTDVCLSMYIHNINSI